MELGQRYCAKIGQLNPLFHTSADLVNRVGVCGIWAKWGRGVANHFSSAE